MGADEQDDGALRDSASVKSSYRYPFAAAPDIIRSNQKDAYFQAILSEQFSTILRNIKGARFVHNYSTEARAIADTIYLGLTTFVGNRTLGEEYCDIVQVEGSTGRLPTPANRAGYIMTTILLPYASSRLLPRLRRLVRNTLEARLAQQPPPGKATTPRTVAIQSYVLEHLDALTSPAPIYALSLATFYFTGAYYHISKRLYGLRYIFTHTSPPSEQRAGYEVLGVLLILQLAVQAYIHLHSTLSTGPTRTDEIPKLATFEKLAGSAAVVSGEREVSLNPHAYSSNNALLAPAPALDPASDPDLSSSQRRLAAMTHTENLGAPRYDLEDKDLMRWLPGRQARKCTLCLEPMKDPSSTTCGHLFCWVCICDWCREKPECPLCRQGCLVQHILPLRE